MPYDITTSLYVRSTTQIAHWIDRLTDDDGQATTEYALVLLGAALVALLLVAWASSGGTAGKIGRLFDRVIDSIIQKL
jgi:Flp pilus assembly pilin Flp